MAVFEICLLLSAAFAGSVAAYPVLASQNSWPQGSLYTKGYTSIVFLGVMITGFAFITGSAYFHKSSWLMLILFISASFVGPAIVPRLLGSLTGSISIIGSIGFLIGSVLIYRIA